MGTHIVSLYYSSVRETLWNFIGHSVLLRESFHKTELISVWLWVYIVLIVLEVTSDISVRLEMRQIRPITYLSCRSEGPMNLADTATEPLDGCLWNLVGMKFSCPALVFRLFIRSALGGSKAGQEGVRESFKDRRLYLECCHSCSGFCQIFQGVVLGWVKNR